MNNILLSSLLKGRLLPLVAVLGLSFTSCSKTEDVKPDPEPLVTPIEGKILALLQQPKNGWEMALYPSNNQRFGGYTLFISFDDKGKAHVMGELMDGSSTEDIEYGVRDYSEKGQITFYPNNKALKLEDEVNGKEIAPFTDNGFQVESASADLIKLVGVQNGSVAFLTPAPPSEKWNDLLTKVRDKSKTLAFKKVVLSSQDKTVATGQFDSHRHLGVIVGGKADSYAYRYTTEGIELFKTENIGGLSFRSFVANGDLVAPQLKAKESNLVVKPVLLGLSTFLKDGVYPLRAELTTGRAHKAITTIISRMSKLQDKITITSLDFGLKNKSFGIHVEAEQKDFLGKTKNISFTLPFLFEIVAPNQVKLSFNAGAIEGGIDPTQNSQLYNYTFGGNHRFDILAACFSNVKEIKVGKKVFYNDLNYDGRTFEIKADNAINPTKITLIDLGDKDNTITLALTK